MSSMLLTTMVAPANNCRAQTPKFNRHTLLSVAIFFIHSLLQSTHINYNIEQ